MFIAFIGMMGVGKSTAAAALAKALNAKVYIEPGAEHWPIPANEPWENHLFALEAWVRKTNYDNFTHARKAADAGQVTIADGALFLINKDLLPAECCQWYYGHLSVAEHNQIMERSIEDYNEAPCPDVMILLEADQPTWQKFIIQRGQSLDENQEMIARYQELQTLIKTSAETLAANRRFPLIRFTNHSANLDHLIKQIIASLPSQPAN